jgi:hypothetical protein
VRLCEARCGAAFSFDGEPRDGHGFLAEEGRGGAEGGRVSDPQAQ